MEYLYVYFTNAFITLYFYIHMYFWFFVLFVLCFICTILEYRESVYTITDDKRGVV